MSHPPLSSSSTIPELKPGSDGHDGSHHSSGTTSITQLLDEIQRIMDVVPVAICIAHDPECQGVTGNDHAVYCCGASTKVGGGECAGMADRIVLEQGRVLSPCELPLQRAARSNSPVRNLELDVVMPSGESATVFGNASPLHDDDGRVRGAVAAFMEITQIKQAHERLREADRLATIGNLAAGLAHDMTNIVLPMTMALEALEQCGGHSEPEVALLRQGLDTLRDFCGSLRQICAGEQEKRIASLSLSRWWPHAAPLLGAGRPRGVRLMGEFDSGLAPICVNERQFLRAVLNLVINSYEAISEMESSNGVVRVWGKPDEDAEFVQVGVSDNGPGIAKPTLDRMFDAFFSTKKRGLSTGMGLAMVRRFAEESHASIHVDSTVGAGATITLRFPAAVQAATGAGARA